MLWKAKKGLLLTKIGHQNRIPLWVFGLICNHGKAALTLPSHDFVNVFILIER